MIRMPKVFVLLLFFSVVLMFAAASAPAAQAVEFSSSLNPVGSGARATGMGGAFIAVADDATAASWNPAGLIQLEKPEVSIVYGTFSRKQDYGVHLMPEAKEAFQLQPGMSTSNTMDANGVNFASVAYPFTVCGRDNSACRNVVFSFSYQRMYEMAKDVKVVFDQALPTPPTVSRTFKNLIHYSQEGSLYALSPALAVQIVPSLSLGITLNSWKNYVGRNGWQASSVTQGIGRFEVGGLVFPETHDTFNTTDYEFEGVNTHAGFLWTPVSSVSVGFVYKTPFSADLKKTSVNRNSSSFDGVPDPDFDDFSIENQTLRMPGSYGAGLQFRASDSVIFSLDVYRTQWSRFVLKLPTGEERNPIVNAPLTEATLKDTTQVRFGTEYLLIGNSRVIAIRGGLFSDPEPAVGRVNRFYGAALGAGVSTQRFSVDASYQYRQGKNVTTDFALPFIGSMDVTQQTLMFSVIYYL